MAQQRQNVQSTMPKQPIAPRLAPESDNTHLEDELPSNQLFIKTIPISKLYTDDTGRFPVQAHSGNQYVMVAYHANANLILQKAFHNKSDRHRIPAYNAIMTRLEHKGLTVDLQILDNKASSAYKETIVDKWKAALQLVPPEMHPRNRARTIFWIF